jgi:hypothetical protein
MEIAQFYLSKQYIQLEISYSLVFQLVLIVIQFCAAYKY